MKVLHVTTSDSGGSGRAVYRLHQGLNNIGLSSYILTRNKTRSDSNVFCSESKLSKVVNQLKLTERLNLLPLSRYPLRSTTPFSSQWLPDRICPQVDLINPDLIHLHWVCKGYVQIETLNKLNRPLIWTVHDMWPFTGGCHISGDCDRYTQHCGLCPQLGSNRARDLSHWIWQRKAKAWKNIKLTLVAPSQWMAACIRASSLFRNERVEVIPNGLDIQRYKPIAQQVARQTLNLPQDSQLILFGAMSGTGDPNKGFHLLKQALQHLSIADSTQRFELVIFGDSDPLDDLAQIFPVHLLGRLHDDYSLALAYSAADVMVVPSKQESFGQTAAEAIACGTPVVAFNATGLKDIVDHHKNGYLAEPYDVRDLAQGITWVLQDQDRWYILSEQARQKAQQEFALTVPAQKYAQLYQEVLQSIAPEGER
jgi:glycosyltransferase involved in cell wall biosynthesis